MVRGGDRVGWAQLFFKKDHEAKVQKGFRMVGASEAPPQELIDDLLEKGMMEPTVEGPWNSNVFPVPKKTPGNWRLVGAHRHVNTQPKRMHIQHP